MIRARNTRPNASAITFTCGLAVLVTSTTARADPPSWLAREVVADGCRRAVAHAGLATATTRDLATRARASGWLPRVQMRAVRSFGDNVTQIDPYTGHTTSNDGYVLDLRLVFRLDRTVFAPDEVGIARLEAEREARRGAVEHRVLELLVRLEQGRLAGEDDTETAAIAMGARAELELMVGEDLERLGSRGATRR